MKQIERIGLELATLAVVALACLITGNILGRELFGWALPDSVILVRELMIPAIMLPLGMATAQRSHIAVTFLADLASPRWQGRLIILGNAVALLALIPLVWAGMRELIHAVQKATYYDGVLDLPRWPSQTIFLIGLLAMWARLAVLLVGDWRSLRRTGIVPETPHHPIGG